MIVKGMSITGKSKVIEAAGNRLNELLAESLPKGRQVLLALSGGSCLDLLSYIDVEVLSNNITITVLDERYSQDPKINNTAQIIDRGFVESIRMKHINFIDLRIRGDETQGDMANRFNDVLDNWIKNNPNGLIIATLGMGKDGHTSGMITGTPNFDELFDGEKKDKYVIAYTAKNEFPNRVTTTMHFLRKINQGILLVLGEEKREALEKVVEGEGVLKDIPAKIYIEINGEIRLFTDMENINI